MVYPLNDSKKMEEAKNNIVNILKMEGYKLDSGNLFIAFKEAGGEISDFKIALEELTEEKKIKSDSDGNIMTTDDYKREKSQSNSNEDEISSEEKKDSKESTKNKTEEENGAADENELESIIKLKEETDSWLIDKLKNNGNGDDLKTEVKELKERVGKLEKIIKNLTRAFE
tara:strand:+ start:563 stop:1075 length:513 start_codon:yes stop_codon:yes gene_type:complete